ncbi:helix-turn-helix domain-containing protein [Saccharibacillus sp. CPCC 101409]|uniref:AraC family transcriptional regulator n=1 Tax=Saccharibacillus sp. CPCC 101409 TaxID=3058041 RepID=UPI00267101BA|nr:helix-turn-helix domain-containing protein [Saccharibacillus sp. CPCC 101409]MDO3409258.1 helix-turn-helix domain-containing protein [Saccharibacillus sp. CPCC 101409]
MSRTWYRRLLLSYFPIFLLTVTVLIFASFVFINDISRMETKKADRAASGYLLDSVDRAVQEAELSVLEAVEDNSAYKTYFNTDERGGTPSVYAIAQSLRSVTAASPLLESVYIYDKRNESVLTQSGLRPADGFTDEAWIETISAETPASGWQPIREYESDPAQRNPVRVLTIDKGMPLPFGSEGVLVINIKMSAIERMIDNGVNEQLSFLTIEDRSGEPVYQAHAETAGGRALNTLTLDRLGWTFTSGIKAGGLFGWVSVISYLWVGIAAVTVLCAIIYLVYITRRNYKPVQIIMNRIEAHQMRVLDEEGSGGAADELKLIDGVLEGLINHTRDYEQKSRENMLLQRSRLFADLLRGERTEGAVTLLERLSPLGGVTASSRFVVVVHEIARYENVFRDRYTRGDENTLKFALMNVQQEMTRAASLQGWAEWIGPDRLAVLFLAESGSTDLPERLKALAEDYRSWTERNLRISLRCGIGHCVQGIERIGNSHEAAESALRHKLLLHGDIVLADPDEPSRRLLETYNYLQTIAELVKQFRMSSGQWREHLERIFESFERDFVRDDVIRSLIRAMLDMLGREVALMSERLQEALAEDNTARLRQRLDEAETLGEVKTLLLEYLTDLFRIYVSVSETKSYRAMVSEMKTYIEENFTNPDLSLKHLSDRFQITGKYASYLFKTEFDMKFVDFVTELRMKEAERLLLETDEPLQEIALRVGYANAITFGRVFKRISGITPGDYRRTRRDRPFFQA